MSGVFRITVEPSGREVMCREDQSVLDACLRAGVWLPHSCTHGTCGTCKAEILDGEVDHGDASSFALMDFERDEGRALLCCATPRSDLVVEGDVEEEDGVEYHPVRDYTAVVTRIEDCAVDVRRLVLDLNGEIAFNAGQYVRLEVPGKDCVRTYSMASPPSESRRIELQVRRVPGGAATDGWIFSSLAVGDRVQLAGPYGRFFYREHRTEPAVLVAGGTGLAPMKSMVRQALESGMDRQFTLYHGARTREQAHDVEFFTALAQRHPDRLTYRPCLSAESVDGFARGHVTEVLDAELETGRGRVAYLCGPPPMVEAALKVLMRKRLFPRDIYREDFFDERDRAAGTGVRSPLLRR